MMKKIIPLCVAMLVVASACVIALNSEDSSAAYSKSQSYSYGINQSFSESFRLPYASTGFSNKVTDSSGMPSWVSASIDRSGNATISGTTPGYGGTFSFTVSFSYSGSSSTERCNVSYTITVIPPTYTVYFDSCGGSSSPGAQSAQMGNSISLPSPGVKTGYNFVGWYTDPSGGSYAGAAGNGYAVNSNVTLYAHWSIAVNVHDDTVIAGQSVSYTPVSSGTVSVTGADWLYVNGNVVYGTAPGSPGVYRVTVTQGTASSSFNITVIAALVPTSTPANGAMIFVSN